DRRRRLTEHDVRGVDRLVQVRRRLLRVTEPGDDRQGQADRRGAAHLPHPLTGRPEPVRDTVEPAAETVSGPAEGEQLALDLVDGRVQPPGVTGERENNLRLPSHR